MDNELVLTGDKMTAEIIVPLRKRVENLIARGVNTEEEYVESDYLLREVKDARAHVAEVLDAFVEIAHQAHKKALAERKKYDEPLIALHERLKPLNIAYYEIKEKERIAAQEKADALARKQAEDERLAEASKLEEAGETKMAEKLIETPVNAAAPIIPKMTKPAGTGYSKKYSARVQDLVALVKAAAAGKVPIAAIDANIVFLNQQARAMGKNLNYPGVIVIEETVLSQRGKA